MKAVGLYLRALREAYVGSRGILARQLKTNDSQIERVEGGLDTRTSFLFAFAHAVHADLAHIDALLEDDAISEEVALALAADRIAVLNQLPKEFTQRQRDVAALTERLLRSPRKCDLWIGYGQRLLDEPDDSA